MNEDSPELSAAESSPTKSIFQPCVDDGDIVRRFSTRGSTIRIQWAKMAILTCVCENIVQMVSSTATVA